MYVEILLLVMGTGVTEVLMHLVVITCVFNIVYTFYTQDIAISEKLYAAVMGMLMWYSHYLKTKQL